MRIPGLNSRFKARTGYLYLPPAYLVSPRPLLPVVVLLAGQPGSPGHWVSWMHLAEVLDGYAKEHLGLAPVALVVDDLGSFWSNPMCVDSPLGNSESYLARDVPAWIHSHRCGCKHPSPIVRPMGRRRVEESVLDNAFPARLTTVLSTLVP